MTRIHNSFKCGVSTAALATCLFAGMPSASSQIACIVGANVNACTVAPGASVAGNVDTNGNGHTIENAGTITGRIRTQDDNSEVINSGSVGTSLQTTGLNSAVINSGSVGTNLQTTGLNSAVTNSGSIGTFFRTNDDSSAVTNSGSVGTNLRTVGLNSAVINSGTVGTFIQTTGTNSGVANSGSVGTNIKVNGANSAVTNSGSVGTFIDTIDANSAVTNSGSVTTFIRTNGASSDVTNTGSIGTLIQTFGDNSGVTNSSSVGSGAAGHGIFIAGLNPYLTLQPGSLIQGDIDLSGVGVRTLNIGNGLSIANTFVTGPDVINSNGALLAQNGLQVAVVDPTNLAVQDELLADLMNGISSGVLNRLSNMRGGVAGVTSNPRPMYVGGFKDGGAALDINQYWVQGFGAKRDQNGDGPVADTNHSMHGFVSGMDAQYTAVTRAGFFLGSSFSNVEADFSLQESEVNSVFGGLYLSTLRGRTAIDMAMTAGYSDYDQERLVANNLAANGLETARADYGGLFISPEITLTRPFWPMGKRIEQSVTLRYAGLFLDDFTESGTTAPLTVNDRDLHVGQARFQLGVPLTHQADGGGLSRLMLKGGIELRTQFGDRDISGTLLAQGITFNPGGEQNIAGAFAGLSSEHVTTGGFAFHAALEGLAEDDGSAQVSGKAGIKFQF